MSTKKFTLEQIALLMENPNLLKVTSTSLTYSLAFKQKAIHSVKNGMTSVKFFSSEGLDPAILGKPRIYAAMKSFKKEAASPEGLREPHSKSKQARMEAFAKENLAKKHTKTAIRELQDKVVHLEQQIELLKKTRFPLK
jgi:hypothetical protein